MLRTNKPVQLDIAGIKMRIPTGTPICYAHYSTTNPIFSVQFYTGTTTVEEKVINRVLTLFPLPLSELRLPELPAP